MNPATAIRSARTRAGLSVVKAAEALGVSRQSFHRWEGGESAPALHRIQSIVDQLGMTPAEAKALGSVYPSVHVHVGRPA